VVADHWHMWTDDQRVERIAMVKNVKVGNMPLLRLSIEQYARPSSLTLMIPSCKNQGKKRLDTFWLMY
jgi:hypothetical protein